MPLHLCWPIAKWRELIEGQYSPQYHLVQDRSQSHLVLCSTIIPIFANFHHICQLPSLLQSPTCATIATILACMVREKFGVGREAKIPRPEDIGTNRQAALSCALHCTTLYCTALSYTKLHCTELHYTTLHCTTLHCTVLSYTGLEH